MNLYKLSDLDKLTTPPTNPLEFKSWLTQEDLLPFLKDEISDDDILLYLYTKHFLLSSLLIPTELNVAAYLQELLAWQPRHEKHWSMVGSSNEIHGVVSTFESSKSNIYKTAEPIFFTRSFPGKRVIHPRLELSEKLRHVLDIFYIREEDAWCRIDCDGDLLQVARILEHKDYEKAFHFLVINRDELAKYMALTRTSLIRLVDSHRYDSSLQDPWAGNDGRDYRLDSKNLYGQYTSAGSGTSMWHGIQIGDFALNREQLQKAINADCAPSTFLEFWATNIFMDFVEKISCDPDKLKSHVSARTPSTHDLVGMFDVEALQKYRTNAEKYKVADNDIYCYGAWDLPYRFTEAKQLQVKLIDLAFLPTKEQQHWQIYSEKPLGKLSEAFIQRNILGQWWSGDDPIGALKEMYRHFDRNAVKWWTPNPREIANLSYPILNTREDWESQVTVLHKIIIEGFQTRELRKIASALRTEYRNDWRSIKLIKECLISTGVSEEQTATITQPLDELNKIRNALAHRVDDKKLALIEQAREDHQGFNPHFKDLVKRIVESFRTIYQVFVRID